MILQKRIYFSGENKWRRLEQWPPKNVEYKELALLYNKKLAFSDDPAWSPMLKSLGKNSYHYISDPQSPVPYTEDVHLDRTREYMTDDQRFASRRHDVLSFSTDVTTEDITLGGPLVANLVTSISTTDADFVVKLIDVFPDDFKYDESIYGKGSGKDYPMGGYQMLVRGEIMRGKYRNSFEKPEPFVPGKITEVKYTLPDAGAHF